MFTCTFDSVYLGHLSRVHVVDKESPPDATGDDLPAIGGEASSEHWEVLYMEALQLGVGVTIDLRKRRQSGGGGGEEKEGWGREWRIGRMGEMVNGRSVGREGKRGGQMGKK